MAFKRLITVKVGPQPGPGETFPQGVLISDLNLAFEITRSIEQSSNECALTIYNAKRNTISNMLKEGNNIRVEAGYEDEGTGVIFVGNIISSNTSLTGINRVTNIKAGGIQRSTATLSYVTISMSYSANTVLAKPIKELAAALNLAPFGAEIATNVLPNGFVFCGAAKGAFYQLRKVLKNYGLGMFIDNDVLIIHRIGKQDSRFKFAYLDKDSGLLGASEKSEEFRKGDTLEYKRRIEYSCILNPSLVPNGLVTISGESVKGVFVNEKIKHKGDNFGGEFSTTGEAVAE